MSAVVQNNPTIYTLGEEVLALSNILLDAEVDEETRREALEEFLKSADQGKLEGYCKLANSMKREAEAIQAEEKDLNAKRKARENARERLMERLKWFMETTGMEKAPAGIFTVCLEANPVSCEVDDPLLLPTALQKVKVEADKIGVKDCLIRGEELPGCRLVRGFHVRVR